VLDLLAELPCPPNIYAMISACGSDEDPDNYDFAYLFYGVELTEESIDTLSVGMNPDAETPVIVSMTANFSRREKIKKLQMQERDVSSLTREDVLDIEFCDAPECSDLCGTASAGCQVGYAVTRGELGTAYILKTTDGGSSWSRRTSPFSDVTAPIVAVDCDGDVVVVVNGRSASYAYSHDGGNSWTTIASPRVMSDVFALSATRMWFCGYNGYICYSGDRGASISVQDAGVATTQRLRRIAFASSLIGYAVGDNNACVRTLDGGQTWVAIVGPATRATNKDLYALAVVPNTRTLFVGDEEGNVYRSTDAGDTWETVFSSTPETAGGIAGIAAWDCNIVAFVANSHDPYWYASSRGSMYRSIDGGASWYKQDVTENDGYRAITQCETNKYWVAGADALIALAAGQG
jgi:photosystem II stability/assembly factor-like uncharacterized protein